MEMLIEAVFRRGVQLARFWVYCTAIGLSLHLLAPTIETVMSWVWLIGRIASRLLIHDDFFGHLLYLSITWFMANTAGFLDGAPLLSDSDTITGIDLLKPKTWIRMWKNPFCYTLHCMTDVRYMYNAPLSRMYIGGVFFTLPAVITSCTSIAELVYYIITHSPARVMILHSVAFGNPTLCKTIIMSGIASILFGYVVFVHMPITRCLVVAVWSCSEHYYRKSSLYRFMLTRTSRYGKKWATIINGVYTPVLAGDIIDVIDCVVNMPSTPAAHVLSGTAFTHHLRKQAGLNKIIATYVAELMQTETLAHTHTLIDSLVKDVYDENSVLIDMLVQPEEFARDRKQVDFANVTRKIAQDAMVYFVLGNHLSALERIELCDALGTIANVTEKDAFTMTFDEDYHKAIHARQKVDALILDVTQRVLRATRTKSPAQIALIDHVCTKIIEADENNAKTLQSQLPSVCTSILLASIEHTATLMAATLDRTKEHDISLTYEKGVKMAINEALDDRPPVPVLYKRTSDTITVPTETGKAILQCDTPVLYNLMGALKLDNERGSISRSETHYFGAGRHACPGQRLALNIATHFLHAMAAHGSWKRCDTRRHTRKSTRHFNSGLYLEICPSVHN